MKIDVVSIPVSDQDRAKTFYADVLGFEVVRDNAFGNGQRWVQLRPPGGEASITLVTWFEGMRPGAVQGLVLQVEDIERLQADLKERGLEIGEVETQPWGRFAAFRDPDGNGWVLMGL